MVACQNPSQTEEQRRMILNPYRNSPVTARVIRTLERNKDDISNAEAALRSAKDGIHEEYILELGELADCLHESVRLMEIVRYNLGRSTVDGYADPAKK